MKKSILIVLTIVSLSLVNCNKDNAEDTNPSGEFVTCKVDGVDFSASADYDTTAATKTNGILTIQGSDNSGKAIHVLIHNYIGEGTYHTGDNLSNTNSLSYITVNPVASWMSTFDVGSGTLEVTTDDDNTVEGAFFFEGYNADNQTTKSITNGSFKANFQ